MRELRDRARLAAEALELVGVGRDLAVHQLDRDLALQRLVERAVDGRHPACADPGLQSIAAVERGAEQRASSTSPLFCGNCRVVTARKNLDSRRLASRNRVGTSRLAAAAAQATEPANARARVQRVGQQRAVALDLADQPGRAERRGERGGRAGGERQRRCPAAARGAEPHPLSTVAPAITGSADVAREPVGVLAREPPQPSGRERRAVARDARDQRARLGDPEPQRIARARLLVPARSCGARSASAITIAPASSAAAIVGGVPKWRSIGRSSV